MGATMKKTIFGIVAASCVIVGKASAIVPILVQIAAYISGTTVIAGAIDKLSASLKNIYAHASQIIDEQTCRNNNSALQTLVLDLRDLEAQKIEFGKQLHEQAEQSYGKGVSIGAWAEFRNSHHAVLSELSEISHHLHEQRYQFGASPQLSESYAVLEATIGEKTKFMETFGSINWNQSLPSLSSASREDLHQLDLKFAGALTELRTAINNVAEEASKGCERAASPK
jgi:hypothetical protein